MSGKNHSKLFSAIAPFYNFAFSSQFNTYKKLLRENAWRLSRDIETVLDMGCGTGAFALALSEFGYTITAVDASEKMVKIAKRNLRETGVEVIRGDFFERLPFKDGSFDLLVASYVVHGHRREEREKFYKESKRLCVKELLLHEFFPNRNPLVSFVEFLEGSDYQSFVGAAHEELKEFYPVVEKVRLSPTSGWYICRCESR